MKKPISHQAKFGITLLLAVIIFSTSCEKRRPTTIYDNRYQNANVIINDTSRSRIDTSSDGNITVYDNTRQNANVIINQPQVNNIDIDSNGKIVTRRK